VSDLVADVEEKQLTEATKLPVAAVEGGAVQEAEPHGASL